MRKLLSILAALAVLATCNAQAQSTVPMVMTMSGNGTITGNGITGSLVAHANGTSTWTPSGQTNFNPPSAAESVTITGTATLAIGTLEVALDSPAGGNTITAQSGSYCQLVKP